MNKPKSTLQERLEQWQAKRPPRIVYWGLGYVWKLLFLKKYRVHTTDLVNVKRLKGPFLVISNHASRVDYLYTGAAFLPHRLSYVAGYNEFFRSHLAMVFRLLRVIPKKNFVPEIGAIRNIQRIIKQGGKVILFPEGMSSISGSNQPSAIGTGKLIKHLNVPVYMTHIEGGYLTNTKYCLDDRPGRVEVTISKLFDPMDLQALTEQDIQLAVDKAIHHDDYEWNQTARVAYEGNGQLAKNMHTLLYRCPKCHTEFQMKGIGNEIRCLQCGNGANLNAYYDLIPFDDSCVIPKTPVKWFDEERSIQREAITSDPNYSLSERVRIGVLPEYEYLKDLKTSEIVGEGILTISRLGLSFEGTKRGLPYAFTIPTEQLPTFGMCTDVSFFTTYVEGSYIEFYPGRESTGKWLHVAEELHRIQGGKWRAFPQESPFL